MASELQTTISLRNSFHITSWNVNGARNPIKQCKILQHLKNLSSDICLLQELHFNSGQIEEIKRVWKGEAFEATFTSRSSGVAILIGNNIPFKFISQSKDNYGRYLILKCELYGELCTIINLYRPPNSVMAFLTQIQTAIDRSPSGTIILGGDLNSIFSNRDSSSRNRKVNPPIKLLRFLDNNNLLDIWRTLHPNKRDYTFYSHPQKSYSRIDFLLTSNSSMDRVITCNINEIIISDHAIVSCKMAPLNNTKRHGLWRMNREHLTDKKCITHIKNHMDIFKQTNFSNKNTDNPEIGIVWDTFKAYIRGVMIGYSAKNKK